MILLPLLLTTAPSSLSQSLDAPSALEVAILPASKNAIVKEVIQPVYHSLIDPILYFGFGTFFGSASLLSGIGWSLQQLLPWAPTIENTHLISSHMFGIAAVRCFEQGFKKAPFFEFLFDKMPDSRSSWKLNQNMLSLIPAFSLEDKQLLNFLENRWLAKMTGCYPFLVDWMCPSFGISIQVHPETTNSYARDPATKFSDTYKKRIETWKQLLPHPQHFPLILTRPTNIGSYLPLYLEFSQEEKMQIAVEKLPHSLQKTEYPVVIDLTSVLPREAQDQKQWLDAWRSYESQFLQWCNQYQLDPKQLLCIQRVQQKDIGGIRLLPFSSFSKENIERQYQFLLEWVSRFGLSANRVEIDRYFPANSVSTDQKISIPTLMPFRSKDQWASFFESLAWQSNHLQKRLMFDGTLQVLKDLCASVPQVQWDAIMHSPTRSLVVQQSFNKIKQELQIILREGEKQSFHHMVSHIEQAHAALTSLLEIFTPFTAEDFSNTFREHLTCIPPALQPLTGYAIHTSAMTSLGGIFKAVEKTIGRPLHILFGENTYFECIHASERITQPCSIQEATEEDWKNVDLILAQFNPTVKRINFKVTEYQATEYHVEKIADILHRALKARGEKPLSIALDCTLDYSNSPRIAQLLSEFQKEIESGQLNILCYRSGLKFDLFGMDNYCGAPFFMINNRDPKWSFFEALLTDPALQTDALSLNWFCLAYQHASPYLEMYRKQVFDNTRDVLNKIPPQLFDTKNPYYRVIPMDSDVDPSFIDIKIFGPNHAFRGEFLVGSFITVKCMEAGYPLLFRPSIAFHHPNLAVLYGKECTTVRLTVGLDPGQVDVIARCLEQIGACNASL